MNNTFTTRIRAILFALTNRGIPFHNEEQYNPFFIVGSGRCGTTLLRRILTANEGIYIPPENWSLGNVISRFKQYRWYNDWNTIVDITVAAHCQSTQGWFEQFPVEFVKEMKNCPEDKKTLSRLLNALYHYQAEKNDSFCNRWGDKTPVNVKHMNSIIQVFPDARFIHMLRDGVDVVHSWKKHGYYGNDLIQPANRWISAIESVEKFRKRFPDNILEVRYERLVTNQEEETGRISRYLSIPFDEGIFDVGKSSVAGDLQKHNHYENALKPVSDDHIGKGRRNLTGGELKQLAGVLNQKLIELQYDPLQESK